MFLPFCFRKIVHFSSLTFLVLLVQTGYHSALANTSHPTKETQTKHKVVEETFGNWKVRIFSQGKWKFCYVSTQPLERLPAHLKRDAAYFFVTNKVEANNPDENIHNEISLILGFPLDEQEKSSYLVIGDSRFELLPQGENALIKNQEDEGRILDLFDKELYFFVKARSKRGNQLSEKYSLWGFAKALNIMQEKCKIS